MRDAVANYVAHDLDSAGIWPAGFGASGAGYVITDYHPDAAGDSLKDPELVGSLMAVPADDPATQTDDTSFLLFDADVLPATNDTDWALVTLDTNGDLVDDYRIVTPDLLMVVDEFYDVEIERWNGTSWVGTGQVASWLRVADGYVAGFDWRSLGLSSVRFAFGLTDLNLNPWSGWWRHGDM